MTYKKLNETYYQLDCLWTGNKAVKDLDKITSLPKKNVRSWLGKQALLQFHIRRPKEINHPHYELTKPNKQHQFYLLYKLHNMFEGNMYKYIITGDDVASGYNVARPLKTKKTSEFAFAVEIIYKIGGVEIPKVFQCENGF